MMSMTMLFASNTCISMGASAPGAIATRAVGPAFVNGIDPIVNAMDQWMSFSANQINKLERGSEALLADVKDYIKTTLVSSANAHKLQAAG
jgi:hypothetical protein